MYVLSTDPDLHYLHIVNQRCGDVTRMIFAMLNSNGCKFHLQRLAFVVHCVLAITSLQEFHWHSCTHWFTICPSQSTQRIVIQQENTKRSFINIPFNVF